MAKDYKDYGDNVVIHRGGTLVSFPRPDNWVDDYDEKKKKEKEAKKQEKEKPKKQEYVKLTGPEEDALVGLDGRKFDSPEDLASAMVMERNNRIGDFEAELDGMEEQGLDVSMYKEEGWDDEVNYNEALEKIKSNPNQFERYLRTKEKESSLKKGDIYENEYGTKVEIMEVDDKGQTLHKFTQKDGKTDYKNFNEKDVNSMLQHNNYKKINQDDIDNSYFNNYKKDQERLDQAREKMSKPIEKEGPSRSYNKQSYIEAKSQVDREMRRDGDLSDDEYLKKLVDKYTDIENRSPQDYDMKKVLREVKEDALKAREEQRQSEKENLLSGIPQRKEIFPNEYLARDYKKLQNDPATANRERWSQAYEDEVREYGKQLKQDNSNDKYKAYYKEEHLGEPSNYKEGDKIEYKSGYGEKLTGTIVREATDKEKEFQMNKNLKGYVVKDEFGEHIVPDTRIQVGKTIAEANKAYKDNKPIIDSNKTTNDYMNDKIRNSNNKTVKALGNELRKKNGPVGLNDAKNYMELDGSSFVVNYRDARGYTSGYMSNSGDNGNGISVRSGQINSLEKYLRENGYERKKSGYSEYVFTWEKPKKSKSQIAKDQLEKYKDNLKDPTKSKVTKADMLKKIFKK